MIPRHLSTACVAALALATSACEPKPPTECAEPLYGGKATDEAWLGMVDARARPLDTSGAVLLVSPTEGELYAANAPAPTWTWARPEASLPPSAPAPRPPAARASHAPLAWLGELLLPSAHAHLPPYTGELYWVEVSAPDAACPVVQLLTSELSWQLDASSWAELGKHAGKALSVQVTRAYLVQNAVTEGPYRLEPPRTIRRSAP